MVETARELESEVEPEDGTELLQSHDKNQWGWTKKVVLEMENTPSKDVVKTVEITEDLEYYIRLFDKAAVSVGR